MSNTKVLKSVKDFNKLSIDDLLDLKINNVQVELKARPFNITWEEDGSEVLLSDDLKRKILFVLLSVKRRLDLYKQNESEIEAIEDLMKQFSMEKIPYAEFLASNHLTKEEFEYLSTVEGKATYVIDTLKLKDINSIIWTITQASIKK